MRPGPYPSLRSFPEALVTSHKSLFTHHSLPASFLHRPTPVHCQSLKPFRQSARPANLHPIHLRCFPQTEMHSHIVVRVKTRPASHFVHANPSAGAQADPRSNPVPVRFRSHSLDAYPMIFI